MTTIYITHTTFLLFLLIALGTYLPGNCRCLHVVIVAPEETVVFAVILQAPSNYLWNMNNSQTYQHSVCESHLAGPVLHQASFHYSLLGFC